MESVNIIPKRVELRKYQTLMQQILWGYKLRDRSKFNQRIASNLF